MKLYTQHRAPNPRRVRWFMAEKGVDFVEIVETDIFAGAHKTPEYRARAGLPHVPALELDDGTTITESVAICRYLEALQPEPNLMGADAREIAVIEMWTRRCELYFANPLMMAVRLSHPALAALEPPNPAVAEFFLQSANRFLRVLEAQLSRGPYITGRFSFADIVAGAALDFARLIRFRPEPDQACVLAWWEALRERPAFATGA